MKLVRWTSLLFASAVSLHAAAGMKTFVNTIDLSKTFQYTIEGREWSFTVMAGDVIASPNWDEPDSQAPPMPMAKAAGIARAELKRYVDDPEQWRLSGIALHRMADKWLYVISWRPKDAQYRGDSLGIPVLMSGEAVIGKVSDASGDSGKDELSVLKNHIHELEGQLSSRDRQMADLQAENMSLRQALSTNPICQPEMLPKGSVPFDFNGMRSWIMPAASDSESLELLETHPSKTPPPPR